MSILIKGMEMPTNCEDCIFCDGDACLMHKPDEFRSWAEEYKNCPLIPVPDHGDLIDRREAIIDANERAYDFWNCDADVDSTISFLNEQTTIIEAAEGE